MRQKHFTDTSWWPVRKIGIVVLKNLHDCVGGQSGDAKLLTEPERYQRPKSVSHFCNVFVYLRAQRVHDTKDGQPPWPRRQI